ncbi:hypothetical protein C3B44_04490 [Corynebacterium yudongzhengii]|uniref:Membrane transport protein MMPL domain-containing protein n=1 Tax=Corynebacterium yudongzhengii TaxID=2080740 RepID=A0A2U1T561_9CORY|nr:MMPL family transporter [Corynebacterium yudongzhengii]AWB81714.1 hypothetical protein C3B44_04490 [Corynebacterium yudongzhengii]PWC01147.1 hypothetical protein DF222_08740 [Corynebacterium yudongzhengii]
MSADSRVPKIAILRWIALLLIALGAGAMFAGSATAPVNETAALPDDADATRVSEILAEQPGNDGGTALIFIEGENLDYASLEPIAEEVGGPLIPNEDGTAALVPAEIEANGLTDNADAVNELRAEVSDAVGEGVTAQVTGPAAIEADLSNVFDGASFLLLSVTAVIVTVLLVVTYRSPILWIIPLLVIAVADRTAQVVVTWVLASVGMTWDESILGILSVLVFGAGTNYALLLISRYRDELTKHRSRFDAMAAAWPPVARTVTLSALTIAVGVLCLLVSATPTTRSLGVASASGVGIALLFALFCLPGMLLLFGRWIFWPKRPEYGDTVEHQLWDRIGSFVSKRSGRVATFSFAGLLVACIGVTQISTGLSQEEQFIDTPESITAAAELGEKFPDQSATPAFVATQDVDAATEALEGIEGVSVQPAEPAAGWDILQVSGGETAELRDALAGTESLVGGQDAELDDTEASAKRDRMLIFPLVLVLIFISLVLVLRALVGPAIMVASVLLTNVAALGLGWWISTGVFGFDTFDSTTPLYSFVFLVALGIDYSIFLITRARDDADEVGTRRGILTALSSTGGVITSAGILLAAVFAALGVLPLVVLAQVGIVICIGVLLDTLIVRTLLIPAVVQKLNGSFWWPGRRPELDDAPESSEGGKHEKVGV